MNWPKIKNYLIVLLVFANLLIIWLLFLQKGPEIKQDLEPIIVNKMKKDGIIVPEAPAGTKNEIEAISISNKIPDLAKEKLYYEARGLKSSPDSKGVYLYSLANDGRLTIDYYYGEGEEGNKQTPGLSESEALELALSYVPEASGDLSYELYSMTREGSLYEFHFEELYKKEPLPDGYIRITIDNNRLIKLIKNEIDAKSGGHVKIIPYDLALYRLYSAINAEDLPIEFTEVDIVRKMEAIGTDTKFITADTFPYYRFVSRKGSFLVKALAED